MAAVAIPMYIMAAGLMTALGASMATGQDAQQMAALFLQPAVLPFYFATHILKNPGSALALVLSLFPATAVSTYSFRLAFTPVPAWQIAASAGLLTLCALGAVLLAGRAFRLGMLRYGQRLRWRELFGVERQTAE
jgi:ABC-2 type transport system permease protein